MADPVPVGCSRSEGRSRCVQSVPARCRARFVAHIQPQERHGADVAADLRFEVGLDRTDAGAVESQPPGLAAAPGSEPTPHEGGGTVSFWRANAMPPSKRKIEPRRLPVPRDVPRCSDNRPHSVLRLPA